MYPVIYNLFGIQIYSFGLFLALGFIFSLISLIEVGKRFGFSKNDAIDLSYILLISGVVGARVFYIILNYQYYLSKPLEMLLINKGGLVYYGGFIGGIFAVLYFVKNHKLSFLTTVDLIASVVPIGQMFGRIGCFLNGCCFGTESVGKLKVIFPLGSPAFNHYHEFQPVHPVQLYESFGVGIIFLILVSVIERKKFDGQIISLYGILYPLLRFNIEFFRADNPKLLNLFTISQYLSIIIFIISSFSYYYFARKQKCKQ